MTVKSKAIAESKPSNRRALDPKSINSRLYNQVDLMLKDLEEGEHITLKERIAALIAIGRIQVIFMGLRKEKFDDDVGAGSAVKKYAGAFKADDAGGRKSRSRPAAVPERDDAAGDDDLASILDGEGDPDAA